MKRSFVGVGLAASVVILLAMPAFGQQWSDGQTEVWTVIANAWKADIAEQEWVEKSVHERAMGWGPGDPTPRNKASIGRWNKYQHETGDVLEYELSPLNVVVHGDTTVAHYYASVARRRVGTETPQVEHTRWTDVLVKDGGSWQYIAWHGTVVGQD